MRIKTILFGIALLASAQIACAASANVGALTPQPAPTAQPPQIIIVQQPTPAVQQAQPDVLLITILVLVIITGLTVMMWGIAQLVVRAQRPDLPPAQPPTYIMPPPQITEADRYQILRAAGLSPEQARDAIERARWHQQQLPPARW